MKVILLFALFGLSFYLVSGNEDCPPPRVEYKPCKVTPVNYGNSPTCLKQAMQESAEFFIAGTDFLYEYKSCEEGGDYNYDNYKAAATEMIETLKCLRCDNDQVLGTDNAIQKLSEEVAQAKEGVGAIAISLVKNLGVADNVAKPLCILVKDVLKSDCMQKKLKKTVPQTMENLCDFYCNREEDADKAVSIIAVVLKKTGCPVDELLPAGHTVEGLVRTVGGVVHSLAGTVIKATKKIPLAKHELCKVVGAGGFPELLAAFEKTEPDEFEASFEGDSLSKAIGSGIADEGTGHGGFGGFGGIVGH